MTGDEEDEGNDLDDLLLANDKSKQEYNLNSIESRSLYFPSQERDHLKTYNSASSSYFPQESEEMDPLKTYNSASSSYKVQQATLETYNSVDICNKLLSKLQEKYGCLFGQVNINISNFSKPVEDIFEFIRKATNIDLLKQPIFLIDDKE